MTTPRSHESQTSNKDKEIKHPQPSLDHESIEVGQSIPHSGKFSDGPEVPGEREYKGTSLKHAVHGGSLNPRPPELEGEADLDPSHPEYIPINQSVLAGEQTTTIAPEETSNKGLKVKLGLALGGAGLAAVGLIAALSGGGNGTPEEETVNSDPTTDVEVESPPTSNAVPQPTPETTAPQETAGDSVSVTRLNGDTVTLQKIDLDKINSGEAAVILKDAISLYITTGDASILNGIVDQTKAENAVESWTQTRTELQAQGFLPESNPDEAFRYDTRKMVINPVQSDEVGIAKIKLNQDGLYFIDSLAKQWSNFYFDDGAGPVNREVYEDKTRLAYFEQQGTTDEWLFIGYETIG